MPAAAHGEPGGRPPHQLPALAALEPLLQSGTPQARALLEALANGAYGEALAREARALLQRQVGITTKMRDPEGREGTTAPSDTVGFSGRGSPTDYCSGNLSVLDSGKA